MGLWSAATIAVLVYTVIEVLNHLGSRPHGFINRTTWEPQASPLLALPRDQWNEHQLVPWTGTEPVWVELTINNIDATGHPFHLVSLISGPRSGVKLGN